MNAPYKQPVFITGYNKVTKAIICALLSNK